MEAFFGSIWWLIVSLGILVTFHEFGHYWVARRCGVRVLRFSVGFGRPLWSRRGKDGTEYVIAAIPLGGYVKMLDEREGQVPVEARQEAFNSKPVGQRIAIVAAGPLFNLLLCVGLLWLMFVVGKPDFLPNVGRADGLAAAAGFERGDRLTRVDGRPVETWSHALMVLTVAALDKRPVAVEVETARGDRRIRTLPLDRLPDGVNERTALREIGLVPQHWLIPPLVGEVSRDSPAEAAGLRAGDRILALGGRPIHAWDEIGRTVQELARAGEPLPVRVERGGDRFTVQIVPARSEADGQARWILGVAAQTTESGYDALLRYNPLAAIGAAFGETWRMTRETLAMLWRMVTGKASLQNLSGPITIAQYANVSAGLGLAWFLNFLALLSLSLAIINLLPIPVLDGGHLLYYLIELVKGSPMSDRALVAGQYIGLAMLAGLMGLAFYNDILRLLG